MNWSISSLMNNGNLSTRLTWSLEGCAGFFTDRLFLRELSFATKLNGIKLRSENCSITCKDLLLWCSIMSPSTVCTTGSWNSEMLLVKGLLHCMTADLTIIQWFCYLCVLRPWRIKIPKGLKLLRFSSVLYTITFRLKISLHNPYYHNRHLGPS